MDAPQPASPPRRWLTRRTLFRLTGAGIGLALVLRGKKKLDSFNPLPEQTVQTVKENVEWITSSK